MNEKLLELADKLVEIRELKAKADLDSKEFGKQLEQIELDMIQIMTDVEVDAFTRNGVHFTVVTREFKSVNPERKDELYLQMKEKGYEHLFTINANTLQATVKEMISENEGKLPEWLDGLINTYEKQTIRVKKN